MGLQRRRTPCIGICSTTYGDLICRGCKRFAHEIVAWNGYTPEQQERVRERLRTLRDGCVNAYLEVVDETRLRACCATLELAPGEDGVPSLAYAGLSRAGAEVTLDMLGIRALDPALTVRSSLRAAIDGEFYKRSVAHYERSFKTSFSA